MPKNKPFDIQRRVVAHKTVESWDTIPHAGVVIELDVTEVVALVRELRTTPEFTGVPLTLNSVMLKIIAESFKASPALNARITYNKRNNTGVFHYLDSIDIAVPLLASCNRMITPVLRDAGSKSLRELCLAMEDLKRRACNTDVDLLLLEAAFDDSWKRLRKGQLLTVLRRLWANLAGSGKLKMPPRAERRRFRDLPDTDRLTAADLLDATTLVSNVGSILPDLRCHGALLEIIPPQISAFALAGVRKQPVVMSDDTGADMIVVRQIMPVTMYADHRAIDLEHGLGFLKRLLQLCEAPAELC